MNNAFSDSDAVNNAVENLRNNTVTVLDLQNQQLGNRAVIAPIANALCYNKSTTHLNLSNNNINNEGALRIGLALAYNKSLKELILEGNNIDDEGITSLANALESNYTLTDLRVTCNNQVLNNRISNLLARNNDIMPLQRNSTPAITIPTSSSSSHSTASTDTLDHSVDNSANDRNMPPSPESDQQFDNYLLNNVAGTNDISDTDTLVQQHHEVFDSVDNSASDRNMFPSAESDQRFDNYLLNDIGSVNDIGNVKGFNRAMGYDSILTMIEQPQNFSAPQPSTSQISSSSSSTSNFSWRSTLFAVQKSQQPQPSSSSIPSVSSSTGILKQ